MKKVARIKRDMLIYKLAKEQANYPEISAILMARGYAELHPDHIGKIVRKMRANKEATK